MNDPYILQHDGLVQVHRALAAALAEAADRTAPVDALVPRALAAGRFVLGHHHAESAVLFPGLRRASRLATDDVAFLDACDRDHRAIHRLAERLLAAAGAPQPGGIEVATLAGALADLLAPHVAEEEAGLAPERLRRLVTPAELASIAAELEALRR